MASVIELIVLSVQLPLRRVPQCARQKELSILVCVYNVMLNILRTTQVNIVEFMLVKQVEPWLRELKNIVMASETLICLRLC